MMKNLLIIGQPRTGKSTLANMICDRLGWSVVSIDALVASFRNVFPELGLHLEPEIAEPRLAPFVFEYMKQIASESPNLHFVIEGCHISPETVAKHIGDTGYNVVCLGVPTMTPQHFFELVKQNDPATDWAAAKESAEILQMAECFINRSKQQQAQCLELNIPFIDTSSNRDEKFVKFINGLK